MAQSQMANLLLLARRAAGVLQQSNAAALPFLQSSIARCAAPELGRGRSDTRQEQQQISDQVSPSAGGARLQQSMCGVMLYVYCHDHYSVSEGLYSPALSSSSNRNPRVACARAPVKARALIHPETETPWITPPNAN